MCGIGGIYLVGDNQFPVKATQNLFDEMSQRGRHACGAAWMWKNSDKPVVFKTQGSSTQNLDIISKKISGNVRYAMLHTRYSTGGSIQNNYNNHPVVRDDIILTHNGVVDDDAVFDYFGIQPNYEVDTECINVALRESNPQWVVENIQGSMSLIWVDTQKSNTQLNFITNGRNPLVFARDTQNNLLWASCEDYLNDFDIVNTFHALPFKHYTIDEDGVLESRFVSDKRAEPVVIRSWSHYGSENTRVFSSLKGQKKPSKSKKVSKRSRPTARNKQWVNGTTFGGMIYDAETDSWKNW